MPDRHTYPKQEKALGKTVQPMLPHFDPYASFLVFGVFGWVHTSGLRTHKNGSARSYPSKLQVGRKEVIV